MWRGVRSSPLVFVYSNSAVVPCYLVHFVQRVLAEACEIVLDDETSVVGCALDQKGGQVSVRISTLSPQVSGLREEE